MDDYQLYIKKYPDHILIQTDSVEGRKGDKLRLLTVMFVETGFQLAFLYHVSNASQEVSTKLLSVMRAARKYTSKPLVVLTDNGIEFSKITLIEKVKNVHVFFADPYKSTDKANCERNHELIRYVIPKGYSLDGFTQKQAVLTLYALSAAFGMFAIILLDSGIWKALSFAIIMGLVIAMGYKEFIQQKLLTDDSEETEKPENVKIEGQIEFDKYDNVEDIEKYRKTN